MSCNPHNNCTFHYLFYQTSKFLRVKFCLVILITIVHFITYFIKHLIIYIYIYICFCKYL